MHWHFLVNVIVALVLGTAIGLERQWRQHQAGLRTNALVAVGAAMFVSLSHLMDDQNSPTRIASYIVSGLGFLGGGVILRDGLTVKGMNTAATIWCTGAIGTLAGAGFPLEAIIGTAAILTIHTCLRPMARSIDIRTKTTVRTWSLLPPESQCAEGEAAHVRNILMRHIGGHPRMNVQGITTEEVEGEGKIIVADVFAWSGMIGPRRMHRPLDDRDRKWPKASWQRTSV